MKKSYTYYFYSFIFFSSLFLFNYQLFAQSELERTTAADSLINQTTSSWGILIGGGFNHSGLVEIGFGGSEFRPLKYLLGTDKPYLQERYMVGQLYLSSEFIMSSNQLIVAPKVGINNGISFVNYSYCTFSYYTDFKEGAFSYRPEIGVSLRGARLFYAYNIPISNKNFLKNYKNNIGLTYFIKTGKTRTRQYVTNKEKEKKD